MGRYMNNSELKEYEELYAKYAKLAGLLGVSLVLNVGFLIGFLI